MYFKLKLSFGLLGGERETFITSLYRVVSLAPRLTGFNFCCYAKLTTRLTTASSTRKLCAS